jgi:hypothetical protein
VAGGTLLTAFALYGATLPEGCVGAECDAGQPERDYPAGAVALLFFSFALIALASLGLAAEARRAGTLGRVGRVGGVLVAVGFALYLTGLATNLFSEELPPLFVVPGILALGVGSLLVVAGVLRAGLLSRYVGVALGVGAVAVLAANEEDWRVILLVPFGLAWVVLGVTVLRGRSQGSSDEAAAEARS